MKSHFSDGFFINNRRQLRRLVDGDAPIVVTANGLLQRGGDSSFAFAQDANFWYLTGINEPDIVIVIDSNEEYLIVPSRSASRQAFDGSVDYSQLTRRSGVKKVYEAEPGWEKLVLRLTMVKQIATPIAPPAYIEQHGLYTNPARAQLLRQLKQTQPRIKVVDVSPALIKLRMIKQTPELAAISAAIDITMATLTQVLVPSKLKTYSYEYEVEAVIRHGFRTRGATGDGFEPIVAGGANACTLHNVANNAPIQAGELIVIDVGAEVEQYSADITRTVCAGSPSNRQYAVHQAVQEIQTYAMSLLKPGVDIVSYEQQIEKAMGKQLQQLKLITINNHKNVRHYYPHSTSHFLGLNVHDVGDYRRPLEPGMVMTVEPGIYIPEEGIGVRIEDDVLVTKSGNSVLSDALPRMLF